MPETRDQLEPPVAGPDRRDPADARPAGDDRDAGPAVRRRPGAQAVGAGLVVAGAALMIYGAVTGAIIVPARVIVFLAGLVCLASGLGRVTRAVFGPRFDMVLWLCVGWLVLLVVAAALAPVLPLAEHLDLAATLAEPVNATPALLSGHPLGTNNFGLDLLARSVYGARTSLVVALSAVVIGAVVGGAIGIVAGYFRRGVDSVVGVLTNSLLAVPPLILLIALSTVLDPSVVTMAVSLSLLTIPSMVRLARANTIAFAQREFVLVARAIGASRLRVMVRELLPNVLLPMLSMAVVLISVLIVAEASLSFLGLGFDPPHPSWGNMIAEGQGGEFEKHPHLVVVPGVFLFLTVFSFNLLGEKAQKRWDPRGEKL